MTVPWLFEPCLEGEKVCCSISAGVIAILVPFRIDERGGTASQHYKMIDKTTRSMMPSANIARIGEKSTPPSAGIRRLKKPR